MIVKTEIEQSVDMAEEWFDYANVDHFWIRWRMDAVRKLLKLPLEDKGEILEIGCGSGVFLKQLRELSTETELHGCDLDANALKQVEVSDSKIYLYDIHERDEDFKERFSAIFLMDVIEHIDDDQAFLDSALFHLKPGGLVCVNVPALSSLFSRYDTVAGHKRRYTSGDLAELFQKLGMVEVRTSYWGILLMPIALVRKFVLLFVAENKVIETGFKPPSKLVSDLLNMLRRLEKSISFPFPFGCSLVCLARKK